MSRGAGGSGFVAVFGGVSGEKLQFFIWVFVWVVCVLGGGGCCRVECLQFAKKGLLVKSQKYWTLPIRLNFLSISSYLKDFKNS